MEPIVLVDVVAEFRGDHWTLSDFSEHPITVDGHTYPTVEHWFQAVKAVHAADHDRIRDAATPAEAKALGRRVEMVPLLMERRGVLRALGRAELR